jgi:hypothetical protein
MGLRLGPLTLPWPREATRDDPYWDFFLKTPAADVRNSVPDLIRGVQEGAINPVREEVHTPEINAEHIKDLARFLGTDLIGVARLDPANEGGYPYAVVCVVRAACDPRVSPGVGGQVPVQNGLFVRFVLSAYIRELGFRATAVGGPPGEPLAAAAGLGTLDAQGRLVTPQYGAQVHVTDVIRTDLPLAVDG